MNDSDVLDVNEFYSRLRSANNVLYLNNETLQSVKDSLESFANESATLYSETYEAAKKHISWYALTIQLFIDINNQEMDIIKNLIDQSIEINNLEQSSVYSDCVIYGSDVNYNINLYKGLIDDCNADITKEKAKPIPNPWYINCIKAERENYKDILEAYEEVRDAYDNFQSATSTVLLDDVANPIYASKEQISNTLDLLKDSYDPTNKTYSVPEEVKTNSMSVLLTLRDLSTSYYRKNGEIDIELVIKTLSCASDVLTYNETYGLANVLLLLPPEDLQKILNDSRVDIETFQCVALISSQLSYTDYQIDNGENREELRKEYLNSMALLAATIELDKTQSTAYIIAKDAFQEYMKNASDFTKLTSELLVVRNISVSLDDNGYYAININWDAKVFETGDFWNPKELFNENNTYTCESMPNRNITVNDFSDINELDHHQDEYNTDLLQNSIVDIYKRTEEIYANEFEGIIRSQILGLIPVAGGPVNQMYSLVTDSAALLEENTRILVNNSYIADSIETTEMINIYQSLGCNSGTFVDTGNSILLTDISFSDNTLFLYTASYLNENGSGFSSADVKNQMKNILLTVESEDEQSAFGQYYKWFGKSLNSRTEFDKSVYNTYDMLREEINGTNSDVELPFLYTTDMTVEQLSEIVDYMNDGNIDNFDVSIFVQE